LVSDVGAAVVRASLRKKRPHGVLALGFHQLLQMAVVVPDVAVTAAMVTLDSAIRVADSFPAPGKE
jgi:hypothetical protein